LGVVGERKKTKRKKKTPKSIPRGKDNCKAQVSKPRNNAADKKSSLNRREEQTGTLTEWTTTWCVGEHLSKNRKNPRISLMPRLKRVGVGGATSADAKKWQGEGGCPGLPIKNQKK